MKKRFFVTLTSGAALCLVLWKISADKPTQTPEDSALVSASKPAETITNSFSISPDTQPNSFTRVTPEEQLEFNRQKLTTEQKLNWDKSRRLDIKEEQKVVWLDSASQNSRRRIRFVKADFKYENLLFEEEITTDPATGETIIRTLRGVVADHLTVGLKDGADPAQVAAQLEGLGYKIRKQRPYYVIAELEDFISPDSHSINIARIEAALPDTVKFAESDHLRYTAAIPNDERFDEVYGHNNEGQTGGVPDADIDAVEAWDTRHDASDIIVAIVDTGLRHTHEDLAANIWYHPDNPTEWGIDAVDGDDDPSDEQGHGTHVAGTVGAVGNNSVGVAGVAWNVQLMTCRVLNDEGVGTGSDIVDGYDYARENGAHIINASLGGPSYNQLAYDAIERCIDNNLTFVAAAGNDATDNDKIPQYPASYELPNLVTVAAVDDADQLANFSNYGVKSVDIAAHGVNILSCSFEGDNKYEFNSGTSMACPQVAGAMAVAYAQFPGAPFEYLIDRLYQTADSKRWLFASTIYGSRLNLEKLLNTPDSEIFGFPDDFADAATSNKPYQHWKITDVQLATREADENTFAGPKTGEHTVWFKWTAPINGTGVINARSGHAPLNFVIFKGADKATMVKQYDSTTIQTVNPVAIYNIPFTFKAGDTFTFTMGADTITDDDDNILPNQLDLAVTAFPTNDDISKATEITFEEFTSYTNNINATQQHFEIEGGRDANGIDHGGPGAGFSVWHRWVAPYTGRATFSSEGTVADSAFAMDTVTAVYKGWALTAGGSRDEGPWTAVSPEGDGDAVQSVDVVAGTPYYIVVDAQTEGDITLYCNREAIAPVSISTSGNGTITASEPAPYYTTDYFTLTPKPASGWTFSHWEGVDSVGADNIAEVEIIDTTPRIIVAHFTQTFAAWSYQNLIGKTTKTAPGDDPDKDGLTNEQEYLHGSNPLNAASVGIKDSHMTEDCICLIYSRHPGTTGVASVTAQGSSNMANWSSDEIKETIIESNNGIDKVKAMLPIKDGQSGFIRLNYSNQ